MSDATCCSGESPQYRTFQRRGVSNESDTFEDDRIEFRPLRFFKLIALLVPTKPLHWYFKHIQLYLHTSNAQRKYANEH